MKKILLFLTVITAVLFAASCQKGVQGPAGPDGEGMLKAEFQQGAFPSSSYTGCIDTVIDNYMSNTNYGDYTGMYIYTDFGDIRRYLVKFDLSYIPAGSQVVSAYLEIYSDDHANNPAITPYVVYEAWDELNATWNQRQSGVSWIEPGGDFSPSSSGGTVTMTVEGITNKWAINKAVVQDWINNPQDNFGLVFRGNETLSYWDAYIRTADYAAASSRPKLTVFYIPE